ncbi:MAG: alcohol dehydrogenase catalytic domain-containing protein, partial [Acidimicrobiales bacterium]|nr:alcohol dehydrogenase catalytic domain-containing protein [Acidimicrobiales bacterium]
MLQARVHGPGDVRLDEVPAPEPGPHDALVRVAACGICGSDLGYIRLGGLAGPGPEPLCLGHEMAGTVEWVGSEVTRARVGDRVVVQPGSEDVGRIGSGAPMGGLTPLLHVPRADRFLHAVPDDLSLDVAAFAEPLAVGMHAADQADVRAGDGVAVFGCGPIGLAAIATLVDRGHEKVVAVEPSARRRELALGLGAQAALDPAATDVWDELASLHGTAPFVFGPTPATAAFIEASGVDRVLTDVIDHAAAGARLSVVAVHYSPVPTSFLLVMMKELTLRGSMEYPPRFADAIDLLTRRDLSALLTHRYALLELDAALATLEGSKDCGKV